jgi:hypothetical protein
LTSHYFWGEQAEFTFLRGPNGKPAEPLKFFNTLWRPEAAVAVVATVLRISHPTLGDLRAVRTDGLDYAFVLVDGTELVVNAEEEPGKLVDASGSSTSAATPDNWTDA